eukprot:TRINITY_DN1240_c0_g2_i2.p1 TRINITY_DN1240_c0_g2~~TRINITY_DN1240_c0_g2_i2.p1  ORF type:complete len:215 (-),score=93.11 TRINITY_DN1240_c0_g2_i2:94-738(-)
MSQRRQDRMEKQAQGSVGQKRKRIMMDEEFDEDEEEQSSQQEALTFEELMKGLTAPAVNPKLLRKTPSKYLLDIVASIRPSDMEEALLVLPFASVLVLLQYLNHWLRANERVELVSRVLAYLLKFHHTQLINSAGALGVLSQLEQASKVRVGEQRDVIGFNLAGMKFLQREIEKKTDVFFFDFNQEFQVDRLRRQTKKRKKEGLSRVGGHVGGL